MMSSWWFLIRFVAGFERLPNAVEQNFGRAKLLFVAHFGTTGNPKAEVDKF